MCKAWHFGCFLLLLHQKWKSTASLIINVIADCIQPIKSWNVLLKNMPHVKDWCSKINAISKMQTAGLLKVQMHHHFNKALNILIYQNNLHKVIKKRRKKTQKIKSPKIWSVCFISINGHWRNISMLRKIIHINKPYVGDMSWRLIDYTDISLNNLEARKTYLYIRQQTPLHQILFNIFTTSEITPKSESLLKENLKLYKQHHPKVSKLPNKPKNKMFKRNHNKNAKYMLKPCLKIIAYL